MKLGFIAGYSPAEMSVPMDTILEAEKLGYDCVWTAEAYGSDAVAPAAWILAQTTKIKVGTAIMQIPARTPACTAMTAMTLDALSGGRFVLGLGPSGPQVIEGWHGVPYGKPLTRTREYVSINRTGAAIWPLLVEGATREELAEKLIAQFEIERAQAVADAEGFVAQLAERGLLAEA